jgi:hypothetical protein
MSDQRASVSVEKPFQFSLRHLLIAMAVMAVPIAVFTQFDWDDIRPGTKRIICSNNLSQIGRVLQDYHVARGRFPAAYVADASGRPIHSWRVRLLPHFNPAIYEQYRFDEPWDGPHNRLLAPHIPNSFRCPSDSQSDTSRQMTSYVAIVGPETAWPDGNAVSMAQIKDGLSNTLLVVESHNSGIHWMEPRDLHMTQMSQQINSAQGQGIASAHHPQHAHGCAVGLFADGSVRVLDDDLPPHTVRALLTIAGGEDVELP